MNNLAMAYRAADRLDEALSLIEETVKRRKEKWGSEHPMTMTSVQDLALTYADVDRPDEAVALLEELLSLQIETLGPNHPDTLATMNNLAVVYQAAASPEKALLLLEQALPLMTEKLGPEHPDTLQFMVNLSVAYQRAGQPEEALPLFARFVTAHRTCAQSDDPQFASVLTGVAVRLLTHQQYSAAEPYLREGLSIREKTMANHWLLFNAQSLLGEALTGKGKKHLADDKEQGTQMFKEAEPLLLSGYEGMKKRQDTIPAEARDRLIKALQRIVDLYTVWGKPAEAANWQKQLDEAAAGGTAKPR
jgi:tetratricopeptide (TPR) repeat protein